MHESMHGLICDWLRYRSAGHLFLHPARVGEWNFVGMREGTSGALLDDENIAQMVAALGDWGMKHNPSAEKDPEV